MYNCSVEDLIECLMKDEIYYLTKRGIRFMSDKDNYNEVRRILIEKAKEIIENER